MFLIMYRKSSDGEKTASSWRTFFRLIFTSWTTFQIEPSFSDGHEEPKSCHTVASFEYATLQLELTIFISNVHFLNIFCNRYALFFWRIGKAHCQALSPYS
mmetsp:Transcript_6156/g.24485  ORF Transcript_6156/g.24485 Transcript_6156/m.24485 type:complete len:101 (-) Transcript_6156:3727-4029(-)